MLWAFAWCILGMVFILSLVIVVHYDSLSELMEDIEDTIDLIKDRRSERKHKND